MAYGIHVQNKLSLFVKKSSDRIFFRAILSFARAVKAARASGIVVPFALSRWVNIAINAAAVHADGMRDESSKKKEKARGEISGHLEITAPANKS